MNANTFSLLALCLLPLLGGGLFFIWLGARAQFRAIEQAFGRRIARRELLVRSAGTAILLFALLSGGALLILIGRHSPLLVQVVPAGGALVLLAVELLRLRPRRAAGEKRLEWRLPEQRTTGIISALCTLGVGVLLFIQSPYGWGFLLFFLALSLSALVKAHTTTFFTSQGVFRYEGAISWDQIERISWQAIQPALPASQPLLLLLRPRRYPLARRVVQLDIPTQHREPVSGLLEQFQAELRPTAGGFTNQSV